MTLEKRAMAGRCNASIVWQDGTVYISAISYHLSGGSGVGGGGGGGHQGHVPPPPPPPPPPFRSFNYIFIVAQYSVLNCILNVQLPKAYPPPAPTPFRRTTPISHITLTFHYWCPPLPLFLDPPLHFTKSDILTHIGLTRT